MSVKGGEHRPAPVRGELGLGCPQPNRARYRLIRQIACLKKLLWAHVRPIWPEYVQAHARHRTTARRNRPGVQLKYDLV